MVYKRNFGRIFIINFFFTNRNFCKKKVSEHINSKCYTEVNPQPKTINNQNNKLNTNFAYTKLESLIVQWDHVNKLIRIVLRCLMFRVLYRI